MTSNDDPSGGDGPPAQHQSSTEDQYVSYEAEDGSFVIRDESAADAWIRSDTVVSLSDDGA